MKFRKIMAMALTAVMSLALCSFTKSSSPISEEDEFVSNLNELSPELDKENIYGDESVDVENGLSEEDISLITEYVTYDETHIELDDDVYEVMPVNDLSVSPEEYVELNGMEYPYNYSFDDEFYVNHHKLEYVKDCMSLMNDMAENGYGFIDKEGEMELYENDYARSISFPLSNVRFSWFKITFRSNWWVSAILGALGIAVNFDLFNDVNAFLNASSEQLESCFNEAAKDLIFLNCEYFGDLLVSSMASAVETVLTVNKIALEVGTVKGVIDILKFVFSHYLPGLIRGVSMVLGSIRYQYGTDCEIGLWWSEYNILSYKVE